MPSRIPPGSSVLWRMGVYRRLAGIRALRTSYARKFAAAAFVSAQVPLVVFIVYLLAARTDVAQIYPLLAALVLASVMSFLGTVWLLREILAPIDLTAEALKAYLDNRTLPDLPVHFTDEAGRLMEGTQYTLTQLNATIDRLEHISDTDDLTGLYNRVAGEKRVLEEVARAERDLEAFQLAFVSLNGFAAIVEAQGHSAGDACVSHLASILQLNTRRGDWVARWSHDAFVVGLHRNRLLKTVTERIVHAVEASPCEITAGQELALSVAIGGADYRFGSGRAGLLGDAERALEQATMLCATHGGSHTCHFQELVAGAPAAKAA